MIGARRRPGQDLDAVRLRVSVQGKRTATVGTVGAWAGLHLDRERDTRVGPTMARRREGGGGGGTKVAGRMA